MNYLHPNNVNRVYYYPVDDFFELVKMRGSYLAGGVYGAEPDMVDKQRITVEERPLFDSVISTVMHDVFFHFSVTARDIDNAVKLSTIDVNQGVIIEEGDPIDGQPPIAPQLMKPSIVYTISLPVKWSTNLVNSLDDAIYDCLIYNMLMKIYKSRGNMDLYALARDKYEGDTVMIKSIINWRKPPIERKYRSF